jgi:hypothetical protein
MRAGRTFVLKAIGLREVKSIFIECPRVEAMKVKKNVSDLLTAALVYAGLTLVIAGGFALTMGFAMAATPDAPTISTLHESNPNVLSMDHALITAATKSDPSVERK